MIKSKNMVQLRKFITAEYPLIYIVSDEEDRVVDHIQSLAAKYSGGGRPLYTWSTTQGLVCQDKGIENTENVIDALTYAMQLREPALFLFKDVHNYLSDPVLVRKIRDLYFCFKHQRRFVFFLSPEVTLPRELHHEVLEYEFLLPETAEIMNLLDTSLHSLSARKNVEIMLSPEERQAFVQGLKGLTYDEAKRALLRTFSGQSFIDMSLIEKIYEEKQQYCRKTGVLEFVPPRFDIEDVGGLDELKTWLSKRKVTLHQTTMISETMLPRGILLMGVSGCGKSLAVKAISSLWDLPIFRLDMNLVFSGLFGNPEDSFNKALKLCEILAPMLLWIDEIEMGIGGYKAGTSGPTARIFATFLTWLQEHESLVFVAATANRVDLLPAEILRKGRFDQVFFVDLPRSEERVEIFKIHLATRRCNLNTFDFNVLGSITKGWNGAEIEQAVITALIEAQNENREITHKDLFLSIGKIVPLSKTMAEQVKYIRRWAYSRALRASSQKEQI